MPAGAPVEARFSNAISIYTYQTLHTATGGFDRTRLLGAEDICQQKILYNTVSGLICGLSAGEGGYGEVFEANMPNGTVVAVKRMVRIIARHVPVRPLGESPQHLTQCHHNAWC